MLPLMTCRRLEQVQTIQQLRDDYLRTLVAPMDGMWESTVIAQAAFWEIQMQGQPVGYFCLDADQTLLRFSLFDPSHTHAEDIFRWVISTYMIRRAITSTIEPLYHTLCLALQSTSTLHGYLFRDHTHSVLPSHLSKHVLRKAQKDELENLTRFYQANTKGEGTWIVPFLREHLARQEIFVLLEQDILLATGECIPSRLQPTYADLGMVVAHPYRGKGLGSAMLIHLKEACYAAGWKPICSCDASNHASKKAIEKAGFISEHQQRTIVFSHDARLL